MAMTYRPPDDLAELLRLEAYRRHTSQTTIINEAVSLYLAGHHLSDDLPKPPKNWKAPDESFRENLEKVHTDRDVKVPKTAAELSRMSAETNARNAAAEPDRCPKCGYILRSGKCSNKHCK